MKKEKTLQNKVKLYVLLLNNVKIKKFFIFTSLYSIMCVSYCRDFVSVLSEVISRHTADMDYSVNVRRDTMKKVRDVNKENEIRIIIIAW